MLVKIVPYIKSFFVIGALALTCEIAFSTELNARCLEELRTMAPRSSSRDLDWYFINTLKEGQGNGFHSKDLNTYVLKQLFMGRFDPDSETKTRTGRQSVSHNFARRWPQQLAWYRSFLKLRFGDPEAFEKLLEHGQKNDTSQFWKTLSRYLGEDKEPNRSIDLHMREYYQAWSQLRSQMKGGYGTAAILEAFSIAAAQTLPAESYNFEMGP